MSTKPVNPKKETPKLPLTRSQARRHEICSIKTYRVYFVDGSVECVKAVNEQEAVSKFFLADGDPSLVDFCEEIG